MAFDPKMIPDRLIEAVKQRNLVPLVGAGFSKQAGNAFPSWGELLDQMVDSALNSGHMSVTERDEIKKLLARGQYLMAAEALRKYIPPDEFETILESNFSPPGVKPAEVHKAIFRLRPPIILTTNYDRLLEDAYAAEYSQAAKVVTYRDTATAQRFLQSNRLPDRPLIFKIHGSIDDPSSIILSERDYRELIYRQPGYRLFLSAIFLTHAVLMLGFSGSDKELLLVLEESRESLKYRSNPDFILLPRASAGPVETRRLREDFGVQVIPYDPSDATHPEVLEFVNELIQHVP
jgi:hypothetical protein